MTFEQNVQAALELVRPVLARHKGDVQLVRADEVKSAVTIRFLGTCHGCPLSILTLKMGIEKVLYEHIPTLRSISVQGEEIDAHDADLPVVSN